MWIDKTINKAVLKVNWKQIITTLYLCLIAIFQPTFVSAIDGRPYVELGTGYRRGDFGSSITSSLYDVSSTVGYIAPRYDFGITIPFLFLTNESGGRTDHQNGIGDVILRAGFEVIEEKDRGVSLYGSVSGKIPTADSDSGLGTGESDFGGTVIASRHFQTINISVLGGYFKVGDASEQDYNDIYSYGIGASKFFNDTGLSLSFEGRRSLNPGDKDIQDINLGIFHVINSDYSLRAGGSLGLNDSGPDFGFSFGLSRWF